MINIRNYIESVFKEYRKHKYYTLFKSDYDVTITSVYDEIGGGRSNTTSDKTAHAAIKAADEKLEAERFVKRVEKAVEQLPDLERKLIELRYMCKNYSYISDYTIYEIQLPMSDKTYRKVRNEAFEKLHRMLVRNNSDIFP